MKMCRHVCPTGQRVLKSEGTLPYSRGLVAFASRAGHLELGSSEIETLYQCVTCKLCYTWCRPKIELDVIVEDIRADAVAKCPECIPGNVMEIADNVKRVQNPLGDAPEERMSRIDPALVKETPGAKVGYYIGCVTAYRTPEIANSILRVLNEQGVEYQVLGNAETCCGGPLVRAGHHDLAKKQAEENVAAFKDRGIETLIMGCPGCLHAFALDYKQRFKIKDGPKAMHVLDFLLERGYQPKQQKDGIATFHDPCHYARHFQEEQWYDHPRDLLTQSGYELREMEWTRENAQCCGAGGSLRSSYPELAAKIGDLRIGEAVATGANLLVSTCPLCKQHLKEAAERHSGGVPEVVDLFELL